MKKQLLSDLYLRLQSQDILLQKGYDRLLCLPELSIEPKPWQIETALKALGDMQGSALLADEVGLGKTVEAGLIMKELIHRGLIRSILVLVPSPLIEQWKVEMEEKFSLSFTDMRQKGWEKQELVITSLQYPIRSKERKAKLLTKTFDLVIVDEAHALKNHQTSLYKFVYQLKRKNTILLSATPLQNDMREIYNLINIMKPGYLKSRRIFRKEYMIDRFTPKNVKRLKDLLNDVMIRHRRANTLTELPKRSLLNSVIEMDSLEKSFYNDVTEFCKKIHLDYDKKTMSIMTLILLLKENTSSPQAVISTLEKSILPKLSKDDQKVCKQLIALGQQVQVTSKMKKMKEIVSSSSEQYIIYSEFQHSIEHLRSYLEKNGFSVVTFSGALNSKQKEAVIQTFKEGKAKILLSTEAGGQGINLQFCRNLIHFDLPWNPMRIEQRIGRVHRFGQTKEVQIYTIPTSGTIDEYLLYILTSKINLFEMIIGELDTVMSYMKEGNETLETTIGKILLDSKNSKEIEEKMKKIGEDLVKARNEFVENETQSSKLLNHIGVETNGHS